MRTLPLRIGACCAVAAAGAAAAAGADWPQWGGSDARNMVSSEKNLPATFGAGERRPGGRMDPSTLRGVKWVVQLGAQSYGNPTVAGGRVFVGTNDACWSDQRAQRTGGGVVMCVDERTGRLRWRLLVPRFEGTVYGSGFDDMKLGVCSSPTVEGGRVYVVTNRGEVLCLDANGLDNGNDGPYRDEGRFMATDPNKPLTLRRGDADILWRYDTIGEKITAPHDAANCSVLICGDVLFVNTANGVHRMPSEPNPMPDAPSLIALDKKTGKLVAMDGERLGWRVFHGQWSSPSLARVGGKALVLFGGGDGVCYAFDAASARPTPTGPGTLKKVWWYDCNPPEFRFRDEQPIDYWDGDRTRATVRKDFKGPSEIIATPVCHKGRVYVAVGRDPEHGEAAGILHCFDATKTGDLTKTARLWAYKGIQRSLSTVAVADGLVYAADFAGVLHCLHAETGKLCWLHRTGQETWSSPFVADGKVYLGTQRRYLWTFRAGRQKKLLGRTKMPAAVSATPVAANGVLYVMTNRLLYAVAGEGK